MEGIGSEVSQKIRAAIKAKLIELGAYVDDELPDYIMVMVANKRTKSQMDEDLQLFLTSNTKIFTTWLHTVLQKLQEVTVASFELKKESDSKKVKKKKLEGDDEEKSKKFSEENVFKPKKHSKKHKDGKKSKKPKCKSKDKVKLKLEKIKKSEKEKDKSKKSFEYNNIIQTKENTTNFDDDDSNDEDNNCGNKLENSQEDLTKSKLLCLNEAVGKAILGNLKKIERFKNNKNNSNDFSSFSEVSTDLKDKHLNKSEPDVKCSQQSLEKNNAPSQKNFENDTKGVIIGVNNEKKKLLIEDEFNIEPLEPLEKNLEINLNSNFSKAEGFKVTDSTAAEQEKTISVPTEELLKEHNKLLSKKLEEEDKTENKAKSESEDSISPEEMRKQLLLSRAKKKLENSKLAERMKSNSPDVVIIEETNKEIFSSDSRFSNKKDNRNQWFSPSVNVRSRRLSRSPQSSDGRNSFLNQRFFQNTASNKIQKKTAELEKDRKTSLSKTKITSSVDYCKSNNEAKLNADDREKRKNIIKISESLEMEKNMGVKKESDKKKDKEVPVRQRSILSRVVTITDPEAPEIPSIVKVKPREFLAKDKQANKALILKAVADAEKSVATIPVRVEPDIEPKKTAIFTKNLREKRYEKLAVTLSNIIRSPDVRERLTRKISLDSEKSDRSRIKLDSSELSEGFRGKSDWMSRKVSKSDDHFISSKTTVMEKNDKYIRCWLEGVEKAVKDDEIVNPCDMEDLIIQSNFSKEGVENEKGSKDILKGENKKTRIKLNQEELAAESAQNNSKASGKEKALPASKSSSDDGPQIVVTLDGLDSKTVKDIISRNKEAINGPLLSTETKIEEKGKTNPRMGMSTTNNKPMTESKKLNFQKISDRFGRLNKAREEPEPDKKTRSDAMAKSSKYIHIDGSLNAETSKNTPKSKNQELIAQLSEKFGKVDRKFENKKRKYPEEDRRYQYELGKSEKEEYKKSERKCHREGLSTSSSKFTSSFSGPICKYGANCKNLDCRYFHLKKCRFYDDCSTPDCKYTHSETSSRRKSGWYPKS